MENETDYKGAFGGVPEKAPQRGTAAAEIREEKAIAEAPRNKAVQGPQETK